MAIREQENPAESVSASAQPAQLAAGSQTTSRLRVPEPSTVRTHWGHAVPVSQRLLGQTRLGEDLRIRHGQVPFV